MDSIEADPYEQQLQAVFDGCDVDHQGSLDQAGLLQLCSTLQLDQDQAEQLLRCIAKTDGRVTFLQFREGLLKLLNGSSDSKDSDCMRLSLGRGDSPEREVSPKLVLGQKKYGRRSRPESSEQDVNIDIVQKLSSDFQENAKNGSDDSNTSIQSLTVHQSPSEENIISHKSVGFMADAWPPCIDQEDELMRSLLERLGVGKDGYLDQSELALVCECIRSEKYVIEMVQQLDAPINLEDFLSILRRCSRKSSPEALTDRNTTNPFVCSGEGMASPESIVELWEAAGITQASQLLRDLGIDDGAHPLSVSSLAALLEEELRNREDGTGLLQAALALRQAELRCVSNCRQLKTADVIRSSMEQIICERDKLRNDLAEANHRANILAQEVDDHHAKLERLSEEQVRLLEQKHAETLRELSKERESLAQHTARLEREIASLQQVDAKQTAELTLLREKNENLERETRSLNEQIAEGEEDRKRMERELQGKTQLLQRIRELETSREQDQVQPLLERLSVLQAENSSLRDRNDELAVELEALTRRLSNVTVRRQTSTGSDSAVATKRRGNSPLELSAPEDSGEEESPRLGKVRRCSDQQQVSLDAVHMEGLQINTLNVGDSCDSPDVEGDDSETLSAGSIETLDVAWLKTQPPGRSHRESFESDVTPTRGLQARVAEVAELEHALRFRPVCKAAETQTSEEEPPPKGPAVEKLQQQCRDLEFQLDHVKVEVMKILSEKRACSQENCILKERVSELSNRLADSTDDGQQQSSSPKAELEAEKAASAVLREKVNDLEQSLELLKEEYERCEEYWAAKLEEERQIAEREQRATDEKFAELLEKVHEFEQLAAQQNSLATIEEHAGLEQEVTELQDEVRELRRLVDETERIKNAEAQNLLGEIQRLKQLIPARSDAVANAAVQATDADDRCWNNEHSTVVNGTGAGAGADSYITDCSHSAASGASCSQNDASSSASSSSSNRSPRGNRARLCSSSGSVTEKRHRHRLSRGRPETLRYQQRAYSQLQLNLHQQRSQAHSFLQNRWSHHSDELAQLEKQIALCKDQEQKLAQADILVKELYVENTRLWNTIQTMQNQLHRAMQTQEDLSFVRKIGEVLDTVICCEELKK